MTIRLGLALGLALLLTGCIEIDSKTPAISAGARAPAITLAPGRYCIVQLAEDDSAPSRVGDVAECMSADYVDGLLRLTPESEPDEIIDFAMADLTRGAALLQTQPRDGEYEFYFAMMRDDGMALMAPPQLISARQAQDPRVTLELSASAQERLENQSATVGFDIEAGAPQDVLAWLRDVIGLWFDHALRDDELSRDLIREAVYVVRLERTTEVSTTDDGLAAANAIVAKLQERIGRAMTLE